MPEQIDADLQKAIQLIELKRYDRAKEFLVKVIAADPMNESAYTNLALTCYNTHDYTEAEEFVLKCLEIDAAYYYTQYLHSIIVYASGKKRKAMASIQASLELNPEFAAAHRHHSVMLYNDGYFEQALESINKALAINPNDSDSLVMKSKCSFAIGLPGNASKIAKEGLSNDPENDDAWIIKGVIETENGNYISATESFRNAVRIAPSSQQAKNLLLKALKFENAFLSRFEKHVNRKLLIPKKNIIIFLIPHFLVGLFIRSLGLQGSEYISQWADAFFRFKNYSANLLSRNQVILNNIFLAINFAALAILVAGFAGGGRRYYFIAYALAVLSCILFSYFEDTKNGYSKSICILFGLAQVIAFILFFTWNKSGAVTLFVLLHFVFNLLFYIKLKILNLNRGYIER